MAPTCAFAQLVIFTTTTEHSRSVPRADAYLLPTRVLTDKKPSARVPELDLLRFVAAISVVLFHFCAAPRIGGVEDRMAFGELGIAARYGYLGVELFFLISGFVIIMSVQRRTVRGFLVHRALRLYPSFWVAILLTTAAIWFFGDHAELPSVRTFLANLTMLPGYLGAEKLDEVYWTLAVELKFYAIVALLLAFGLLRYAELLAYAWLVLLLAAHYKLGGGVLRSASIYPHGSLFAAGVLFYFVKANGWTWQRTAAIGLALALAVCAGIQNLPEFIPSPASYDGIVVPILIVCCFALVAWAASPRPNTERPRFWMTLGALTYPLYLVHGRIGRILFATFQQGLSPAVALLTESAVVGIIAWAIVQVVEGQLVPRLSKSTSVRYLEGKRRV